MGRRCFKGYEYRVEKKIVKKPVEFCYDCPDPVCCYYVCDDCGVCCGKLINLLIYQFL